jgi:hypothetical protein
MLYGDDSASIRQTILETVPDGLKQCYQRKVEEGDCQDVGQLWTLEDMRLACKNVRRNSAPGQSGMTALHILHQPESGLLTFTHRTL